MQHISNPLSQPIGKVNYYYRAQVLETRCFKIQNSQLITDAAVSVSEVFIVDNLYLKVQRSPNNKTKFHFLFLLSTIGLRLT
jgi:hypothetical protein